MNEKLRKEIAELIQMELDGTLTDEQFHRLSELLKSSAEARRYYGRTISIIALIHEPDGIQPACFDMTGGACDDPINTALWEELAYNEQTADPIPIEKPDKPDAEPSDQAVRDKKKTHKVSKLSLYSLQISSAALILLIAYALLMTSRGGIEVATLTGTLNARWDSAALREGMRLSTQSRPLWLREGMAAIQFDNGSTVVLEGPAEFSILTDDQVQLRHGRLYASVPGPAVGFTVSTPYSKIIDLGTEFGVKTDPDGMEVHVMAGKTMLISALAENTKNQCELQEGQAKAVTAGGQVEDIAFRGNGFVRRFSPQTQFVWKGQNVNLADIVGGGNGFGTGRLNAGIDYHGQITALETFTSSEGPREYVPVRDTAFVDGVFIPNGLSQVSSNGLAFEFEPTNGRYWLGVLNGAWHQIALTVKVPRHQLRLNGKEYGTAENPAIYLSSNQGITFDLQAIRDFTKMEIRRFTALCGLSETYRDYWEIMKQYPYFPQEPSASFYVLVDGKVRFVQQDMTPYESARAVAVEIGSEDRFLTLVTTQGSDKTNNGDWTLFAEPFLELQK